MDAQKELAKLKELQELGKPLIEYLRDKFNPYAVIVITDSEVTLYNGGLSVPADFDNWDFNQDYVSRCGYPVIWGRNNRSAETDQQGNS